MKREVERGSTFTFKLFCFSCIARKNYSTVEGLKLQSLVKNSKELRQLILWGIMAPNPA